MISTNGKFFYLTTGQDIQDSEHYSHLTNEVFSLPREVTLTNYTIQPNGWMTGGSGVGWLSVDSASGALSGTIEGFNDYWAADYIATAESSSGYTYRTEIAVLTNPFIDGDGELNLNYHHWSNWGVEGASMTATGNSLTGAFANLSTDSYTLADGRVLAPNMVIEPDGTFFFAPEKQDSKFHGNRFDDVFIGDDIGSPQFMWTGGNDKFIGAEGVENKVDFGWYEEYATVEFGSDHNDGVTLSVDSGTMIATTHFGVLEATNLEALENSELDDVITLHNMDYFKLYNDGGSDIINANNIQINAKLYEHNGVASKYVINDYNESSVIRIDDSITEDILGLAIGADYEAATSVYRTNGKTYVDLIGANNQSIEKIVTLDGDYSLNQIKDKGSDGFELRFFNLNQNGTDSNDILGPVGEYYEKDTVLSGLDESYTLTGGLGDDIIGGGSQSDVLDGGEEAFKDQFGNDIDESGIIGHDRLVYYDAPSGIYADLSLGLVQDGYGSTDLVTNFEKLYGSFYDDTVILSNELYRGYLPSYGNDTIIGLDTFGGANIPYLAYWQLDTDDDVTDAYIVVNYDEGIVDKTVIGGEFAGTYQDTFSGYVGAIIGSKGNDIIFGLSSEAYYVPVAGFHEHDTSITGDTGYGWTNAYHGNDIIVALGSGEDRLAGGKGSDLIITSGHGETDKISGDTQHKSTTTSLDFDTFVIGGEGIVLITDYQIGEEIILLDYSIDSQDDITVNYNTDLDQTSLSFSSGIEDYPDRVLINGRLEIDSFEQTTFTNEYTQNTIVDNETKDFKIILKNASASLESKATLTASTDMWLSNSLSGELSQWLDGPVMKLHRKDIEDEVGIDLLMKDGHPGHKHKEDMDKGSYELRVEHTQQTDGAIDIDDVMGVLALSRGIREVSGKEHKLAADWDGNDMIDIDDVMGVLARSRGIRKDDEWRFHDKDSDTSLWDNASKLNKMDIELDGDNEIELSAILRGDVDSSYDAAVHNRAPEAAPTPNAAPLPVNNEDELLTINLDII